MGTRFVAPTRLDSLDDARKAFRLVQEQFDAGGISRARGQLVTTDTTLVAGEFVRISPRQGATLFAKLPKASAENTGARISISLERPAGTLRVSAQAPDTVVGVRATDYTAAGLILLESNGVDAWVSPAELPSTSPGGLALDAEYLLGAAHASLPNGRLATDSTEIDADLATPGVVTWALRTASVLFSKLQDLAGLSVLGRAANSAGVMAAITATAARQTLRLNDAGNALAWGFPVEVQDEGVDQGDVHTINFTDGINATVAAGVATVNALPQLRVVSFTGGLLDVSTFNHNDTIILNCASSSPFTLTGITARAEGTRFFVVVNATGNDGRVLVEHESASVAATERFRTPFNIEYYTPEDSGFVTTYTDGGAGGRWRFHSDHAITVQDAAVAVGTRPIINITDSTSITGAAVEVVASDRIDVSFQRAALTGAITATANSNTTAFGTLAAKSVLGVVGNATAIPAAIAGSGAFQHLRVNSANTGLEWAVLSLAAFPTMAAGTVLANVTAGVAVPTAHALATLAGSGLTYTNVTGVFAVGAGTGITVGADTVGLTDMAAGTVKGKQIDAAAGAPVDLVGSEIAEIIRFANVLTEAVGGTFNDHALDTLTDTWSFTATSTITGIAGGTAGRWLKIYNAAAAGSGVTVTISQFSASSLTGNRFLNRDAATIVLDPGGAAIYFYEGSRWRCYGVAGASAVSDSAKGDITVSASGKTWTLSSTSVPFVGNPSEVTIAGATSNLGTISITALTSGGSVRVTSASSAFSIEGFTAKTDGFWFYFESDSSLTNHCTLFHEDATATAANRLHLPQNTDISGVSPLRGVFYYRDSRWNWVGGDPSRLGTTTGYISAPHGTVSGAEIVTVGSGDIDLTAAGNVNVNGAVVEITGTATTGRMDILTGLRVYNEFTIATALAINDLAIDNATVVRITPGANISLNGMDAGFSGQVVMILNDSTGSSILINHENVGSVAANRFMLSNGATHTLLNRGAVWAYYDSGVSRWRLLRGS